MKYINKVKKYRNFVFYVVSVADLISLFLRFFNLKSKLSSLQSPFMPSFESVHPVDKRNTAI